MRRGLLLTATVLLIGTAVFPRLSPAYAAETALDAACRANAGMTGTDAGRTALEALHLVAVLGQSPSYTLDVNDGQGVPRERIIPDGRSHNLKPNQPIDLHLYHLTTLLIHGSPAGLALRPSDMTREKAVALKDAQTIEQLDLSQTDSGNSQKVSQFRVLVPLEPFLRGLTHPIHEATFAIIACGDPGTDAMAFVSTVYTSSFWGAAIYTMLAAAAIWLAAALPFVAHRRTARPQSRARGGRCWWRGLDPVVITQDGFGFGSVSRLQVFFFTLIVVSTLTYVFLRIGYLSEISETTLALLGITGLGSTASSLVSKMRISNSQELNVVTERWLTRHGITFPPRTARWGDLLVSEREFDVYKFQALVFSALIGCWIMSSGLNNLAYLTIPPHLMALLGLSQGIYVCGKAVVGPGSLRRELNNAVARAIESETAFLALLPIGHPYRIEARNRAILYSLDQVPPHPTAIAPTVSNQALEQFKRDACAAMTLANDVLNGRNMKDVLPADPPDDTLSVTSSPNPAQRNPAPAQIAGLPARA